MYVNKKIRGAKKHIVGDLVFRSKLEVDCYKKLIDSTIPFIYEDNKLNIFELSNLSNVVFLQPNSENNLVIKERVRPITYTPDFTLYPEKGIIIIVEAKGFPNDVYPLKRKLILSYLNDIKDGNKYIFAEVRNVKQIEQLINFVNTKQYE